MSSKSKSLFERRRSRTRARLLRVGGGRPRLSVFRSSKNIYVQLIDDEQGHTLASASTLEAELRAQLEGKKKLEQAQVVGRLVGERARAAGVNRVVFDRGGNLYHGRVAAVADAAREAGLEF